MGLQSFSPLFFFFSLPLSRSSYPCFSFRSFLQLTCLGGRRVTMACSGFTASSRPSSSGDARGDGPSVSSLLSRFLFSPWLDFFPGSTRFGWERREKGLSVVMGEGRKKVSFWLVGFKRKMENGEIRRRRRREGKDRGPKQVELPRSRRHPSRREELQKPFPCLSLRPSFGYTARLRNPLKLSRCHPLGQPPRRMEMNSSSTPHHRF